MDTNYDKVAERLATCPVVIDGVHRTFLPPEGRYDGHKNRRTSKPALLIALQGEAVFHFGGIPSVRLVPGAALIGGYDRTLEIDVGSGGFEYGIVHYSPVTRGQLTAAHLREVEVLMPGRHAELTELIGLLCRIAAVPGHLEQLERQMLFYRLLHAVLQGERNRQNAESSPVVEQAIRYLHDHYSEPVTLDTLAAMYNMKPKYFSYLFHKFTGISPIHYLIRYRMNRAEEMLQYDQSSVREIARQVGYEDPYYFSRLFKKHVGQTPQAVKQQRKYPS